MQNTQILSTQPPLPDSAPPERSARSVRAAAGAGPGGRALVFDACQVGVVLRAVLFVEVVVGVGAMYGASSPLQWLASLALLWAWLDLRARIWQPADASARLAELPSVQVYLSAEVEAFLAAIDANEDVQNVLAGLAG